MIIAKSIFLYEMEALIKIKNPPFSTIAAQNYHLFKYLSWNLSLVSTEM